MNDISYLKRQFFHSLKRGTGEAYLIARNYPSIDFSNYIIKGALNNYAYDGQSENSRAQYIFDLISISSKKDKICKAVLKGLLNENRDTWALTQLFDLAKLFVEHGDKTATKSIRDRFCNNIIEGSEWVGFKEILELDGLNGMIFIARKIGQLLERNPDIWQDDMIIQHFQDDNPEINVMQELEKASKSHKQIKIYLNSIHRNEKLRNDYQRTSIDFHSLNNYIEKSEKSFIPSAFTKNLSTEEIIILADNFLKEKNLVKKEKYLSIFTRIKFPYDYKPIFELVNRRSISINRLAEFAIDALKHIKADEIRDFGIRMLQNTKLPEKYTNLLINNYVQGDAKLLKSIVEKSRNQFVIESLACSYVEIFRTNKTKECIEPIIELYKKMNCGIHRNLIIEILVENNLLPDYINNEIEFDSYDKTRLLHR